MCIRDRTATRTAVDPRLTVRYQLAQRALADTPPGDDSAVWLKASAGVYHQPPRFVLPLPGLDLMPLQYGLLRAFQTSLGVEVPLRDRFQLTTEGYFNYMDPTIFDLQVNDPSVVHLRLGVVHAVALRAHARRPVGRLRLRPQPSDQRGRRSAAAPQLGHRAAPAVPERQARDDHHRLQRGARHR